ncbi:MAG: hypothetical protein Q9213_004889 [Squamulea squamosa]
MEWRYSVPVDPELLQKAGVFTLLHVRRHKHDQIPEEALESLLSDYRKFFNDGKENKIPATMTPDGEMNIFVLPEALPERLAVASRLNGVAIIHDVAKLTTSDVTEGLDATAAIEQSRDLDDSLDLTFSDKGKLGHHTGAYKKLMSKYVYEMVRMDREVGAYMLDLYSKNWTQKIHRPENLAVNTFDDYMKKRLWDVGVKPLFAILEFASGYRLTPDERRMTDTFLELLEKAGALMNDYYSYDREAFLNRTEGVRIFNSVNFFMEHESLSVEAAKAKVRALIRELEQQFLREKQEIFRDQPNLSYDHKCYIEHCEASIGGANYWCAIAYRYNYWKELPGAFPDKESSTVIGGERPTDRTNVMNSIPNKLADSSNDEPMKIRVDGKLNGELNLHGKRKSDATHLNGINRDEKRAKLLQDSNKMQETVKLLDNSIIQAPADYVRSLPSKGVRRILIESLNEWLEIPKASQETITLIVDLLHNASLMLDDCEDGSELRRGNPASHMIFGQAQTINAATFLFVRAVREAANLSNTKSTAVLTEHLETLFVGQSWDLHWREKCSYPSEDEYLEMVDKKTGGLFALLASLMALESMSTMHYDFNALVTMLGRYFQIRDDYVNLTSQEYSEQKGFCEDLDEGKISYCLVMCAQRDKGRADQIVGIFRQQALRGGQKALRRQTKEHILKLLEEAGAMETTREKLRELEKGVDAEIEGLEGVGGVENPLLKILVEMLRS